MIHRGLAAAAMLAACAAQGAAPPGVTSVFVVPGAGFAPAVLYANIHNPDTAPDTLHGIETAAASYVMLHVTSRDTASGSTMTRLRYLVIPAQSSARLAPGGAHGMVDGLRAGLSRGDTVSITFRLAHMGALTVPARVIAYTDVDDSVTARGAR